jgi:hypothetical protein
MTWAMTYTCPDCGGLTNAGKKCLCFPPALPVFQIGKGGRRTKGSVKAAIYIAHMFKMTVPQAAKNSGISAWTLYNAARRLGIKLKPARK